MNKSTFGHIATFQEVIPAPGGWIQKQVCAVWFRAHPSTTDENNIAIVEHLRAFIGVCCK